MSKRTRSAPTATPQRRCRPPRPARSPQRAYPGPLGTATGAERLKIRLYDLLAHGWDLAQATEQPADLPDDLAAQSLAFARTQLTEGGPAPVASARPSSSPSRPLPSSGWSPSSAARSAQDAEQMTDPANQDLVPARLRCGIVVRVREDACEIVRDRQICSVRYATPFPSPRTERVSPGHLVAIATAPDGTEAVLGGGMTPSCSARRPA